MKLAYTIALTGALLGTAMSAGTMAQVGSAQRAVPSVITGAVASSTGISSAPVPSPPDPVAMPVQPSVSLLAARAMLGIGTPSASPACTGTSANAEVCVGWH